MHRIGVVIVGSFLSLALSGSRGQSEKPVLLLGPSGEVIDSGSDLPNISDMPNEKPTFSARVDAITFLDQYSGPVRTVGDFDAHFVVVLDVLDIYDAAAGIESGKQAFLVHSPAFVFGIWCEDAVGRTFEFVLARDEDGKRFSWLPLNAIRKVEETQPVQQ